MIFNYILPPLLSCYMHHTAE